MLAAPSHSARWVGNNRGREDCVQASKGRARRDWSLTQAILLCRGAVPGRQPGPGHPHPHAGRLLAQQQHQPRPVPLQDYGGLRGLPDRQRGGVRQRGLPSGQRGPTLRRLRARQLRLRRPVPVSAADPRFTCDGKGSTCRPAQKRQRACDTMQSEVHTGNSNCEHAL